jgi:hypothetical protein
VGRVDGVARVLRAGNCGSCGKFNCNLRREDDLGRLKSFFRSAVCSDSSHSHLLSRSPLTVAVQLALSIITGGSQDRGLAKNIGSIFIRFDATLFALAGTLILNIVTIYAVSIESIVELLVEIDNLSL